MFTCWPPVRDPPVSRQPASPPHLGRVSLKGRASGLLPDTDLHASEVLVSRSPPEQDASLAEFPWMQTLRLVRRARALPGWRRGGGRCSPSVLYLDYLEIQALPERGVDAGRPTPAPAPSLRPEDRRWKLGQGLSYLVLPHPTPPDTHRGWEECGLGVGAMRREGDKEQSRTGCLAGTPQPESGAG